MSIENWEIKCGLFHKSLNIMKSKKPNKDIIEQLYISIKICETNFVKVWKEYWVSDNAVRKWFKTAWYEPITKKIETWSIRCTYCSKPYVRREWGWIQDNKKKHFNNYCSRPCADRAKSEKGIKGRLSQEEYTELRESNSIRAIGRMYNVSHKTLIQNFD